MKDTREILTGFWNEIKLLKKKKNLADTPVPLLVSHTVSLKHMMHPKPKDYSKAMLPWVDKDLFYYHHACKPCCEDAHIQSIGAQIRSMPI